MLRIKIIFVMLFMLSFSVFHDSLMPFFEKNEHKSTVHCLSDATSTQKCADFNEIHSMLHFMAIVTFSKNTQMQFAKREMIPHLLIAYSPPLQKSSYKPPTL
ncbi:hypothetical protein [Sulfurovum sp.]|uniref:hypothetical protein n=1 Tax=Sulfurovum sp. TaxID=1969726 RepID=UPI002867E26D|nr:hypothetical protein [Sulfurovum sp.]